MSSFHESYAELYDTVYQDKPYDKECDFIVKWLKLPSSSNSLILDFGCGTGNHSLRLAKKGHQMMGVDSSLAMLNRAKEKAAQQNLSIKFESSLPNDVTFDSAICMFAVFNYLDRKNDVPGWFRKMHRSLRSKAFLLIETWNGISVPFLYEPSKEKKFRYNQFPYIRKTEAELDWLNQILTIQFSVSKEMSPNPLFSEKHVMSYYTPYEFETLATEHGFTIQNRFSDFSEKPLESKSFNCIYILQKKD